MKRLACCLVLLLAITAQASTVVLIKKPVVSATCATGKDITFWWRAEATDFTSTHGTLDYSAGDKVATSVATPSSGGLLIDAAAAKNGSNGVYVSATAAAPDDYYQFDISSGDISSGSKGTRAFWFRYPCGVCSVGGAACDVTSGPCSGLGGTCNGAYPGARVLVIARGSGSTIVNRVSVSGSLGSRTLTATFSDGTGTMTLTSNTAGTGNGNGANILSCDNWYQIVTKWDATQAAGSDTLSMTVYNSDGTTNAGATPGSTITTGTADPITPLTLRIGAFGGSGTAPFHLDHIIESSDPTDDLTTCRNQGNYDGS